MIQLTEEQRLIKDTVREFALKEVEPIARKIDKLSEFPYETIKKMGELNLLGIPWPQKYGGAEAGELSYIIAVEELARVCGSTSITLAAHTSLGSFPIYAFGTEEQKKKYLTPLASGKYLGGMGLTEPEAGSDAGATRTTAVKTNGGYIINGSKIFITNASVGKSFIVLAKTDMKAKGSYGLSTFIVESSFKGFKSGKKEDKLGLRGSDTCELIFEDCFVPEENILGKEGDGFKSLMKTLDGGRISIGALALGIAQGALDKVIPYVRERQQFGKPIGSFQAIQMMVADMATEIEASRHLIYHAAHLMEEGKPFSKESAMAKLFASETAMRVTKNAIQALGGYGYMNEYQVERYYRDAKLTEIGEGTSEVQRIVIARGIIGKL
jgi:alkylation response protein AidB-like acyl-CoA dehydrogenase